MSTSCIKEDLLSHGAFFLFNNFLMCKDHGREHCQDMALTVHQQLIVTETPSAPTMMHNVSG